MNGLPNWDDATRAQITAARPDMSTWLSANAGSGKTRVLTDRVARMLLADVVVEAGEVADHQLFSTAYFRGPSLWYYNWNGLSPSALAGWRVGMAAFLRESDTDVPAAWALHGDHDPDPLAAERSHLRQRLVELAGEARAAQTITNLKHPALKLLWWMATRHRTLPPSGDDMAEYLVFLADTRNTVGAATAARQAASYLCNINGWDPVLVLSPRTAIPLDALRRRHRHAVKKSPGLTLECVSAIVHAFCRVEPGVPPSHQWRFAVGTGIGTAFKLLARYDDISKCRYDPGYFEITVWFIRILLITRKNNQLESTWLEIARPADPAAFGVYHALVIGHGLFGGSGFILPRILADGTVVKSEAMGYKDYVLHLRQAAAYVNCPEVDAELVAGQSPRAGAATEAARNHLRPHEICRLAGVKSIDWLTGYNRHCLKDRLRATWALGL